MALTPEDLLDIHKRNKARKRLKHSASEGPWEYDSWAFVHQSEIVPRQHRFGILIRPMEWFDSLGKHIDDGIGKYKKSVINRGWDNSRLIVAAREEDAERDIDALLAEVKRLQKAK
jgi:hypothetical protein